MRALLVTLLATGCAGGTYNLAYRASYGNSLAPPSTTSGMSNMVRYREYAGPIGKFLLALLHAPIEPTGKATYETTSSSNTYCGGGSCTTVTRTESRLVSYEPPSKAELEQYARDRTEFEQVTMPAILSGRIGMEVSLDVASTGLGGDTNGFAFGMHKTLFSEADGGWAFSLKAGLGINSFTMKDRTTRHLVAEQDPLAPSPMLMGTHIEENTGEVSSSFFGIPMRLTVATPPRFTAYYGFDWSLTRAISGDGTRKGETYHPQLTTFGIETMLWRLKVSAELQLDGFNPGSRQFALEAGLVL